MARISGKQDKANHLVKLGEAVRARRAQMGISQEALADLAEIDRSHMGKLERGERNVTILNLICLPNILGICNRLTRTV